MLKKRWTKLFIFSIASIFISAHYVVDKSELGIRKVVIDAGHGGKDPGAVGIGGLKEKDVVLSIALELGEKIKKNHPDVEVIYTRDKDVFVELFERARIANINGADLFLSIHANANASAQPHGTETFALGLHRSKENLEIAKKENSVILMEDNYEIQYEGFDPKSDESYIALTLRQSSFLEQSLTVASKIENEFSELGLYSRGVKQAGFLVLYKTTMPAVLIETGFITNPNDQQFLSKKDNLSKMADAIYKAFARYRDVVEKKSTPAFSEKNIEKNIENRKDNSQKVVEEAKLPVQKDATYFSVQIASSPKKIDNPQKKFPHANEINEIEVNGVYKYISGREIKFSKAVELQKQLRKNGYPDAFVIAINNGQRVDINEARKQLEK